MVSEEINVMWGMTNVYLEFRAQQIRKCIHQLAYYSQEVHVQALPLTTLQGVSPFSTSTAALSNSAPNPCANT